MASEILKQLVKIEFYNYGYSATLLFSSSQMLFLVPKTQLASNTVHLSLVTKPKAYLYVGGWLYKVSEVW